MSDSRLTRPRSHRLSGKRVFAAVVKEGRRETAGPLRFLILPNQVGFIRLGLSVSRAVGIAPRRNRIKRLIRESFRLLQHDLPGGYDVMVIVRPHAPLELAEYMNLVTKAIGRAHERLRSCAG